MPDINQMLSFYLSMQYNYLIICDQQKLENMKNFRKKYIYNPDNPIFESPNVRTYNCMNTQTKDKKLILLEHLNQPPFVEPSPSILQPFEIPTASQPFSVYPIVRCVSQIGKISQAEAMYVIKCITESKLKNPLYSVISQQGIVGSNVEGLLPNKTPDLFQIAIDLLDLPSTLAEVQKSVVSKQGYSICRLIRDNKVDAISGSLQNYGWKDVKKDKQNVTDDDFVVFKGRRKQQGSIMNEQYGLAWHNQYGLCRMKFISLARDGYEEQFYRDFVTLMQYIQSNKNDKNLPFLKIYKYAKDSRGIRIFTEIPDQGPLNDYILTKYELKQTLTQKNTLSILQRFIENMAQFSAQFKQKGTATMHIKQLFVHRNKICIGEPMLITDKTQKKLRDMKNNIDYYAPELKQNIILPQNLAKMSRQKMDIWSFGFVLHKIYAREIPIFDTSKNPVINKQISMSMGDFIKQCLDINPQKRPHWSQIKLRQIQKRSIKIEQAKEQYHKQKDIRLGSRSEKRSQKPKSEQKKMRIVEQLQQEQIKIDKSEKYHSEQDKLKVEDEQELGPPLPMQISSRLKKIKLILKIIIVLCIYIFVFFRPFFANSIDILLIRSYYTTTSLHLVDYTSSRLSSTTVLTNNPMFFLQNDISFSQVQEQYHCIDDHFDPIYNPEYSLLTYIQSPEFLALLLTGWLTAIIICIIKAVSIWKGGISNRPHKGLCKFWFIYGFHELSLAALLFAHFYIFQFFYFSGASPCLSINNFTSLEPFFDSSLYLFLSNTDGYFQQIFSTLGILSIMLVLSTIFYSCAPKLDIKYFVSIPSILFRVIPFILLLIICRIGVFELFSPSAINDTTKIIPALISNSFEGFIGIIPEVFIIGCVAVQVLLQLFMYWCEGKAAESDRFSKLFNIKNRKIDRDASEVAVDKDYEGINNMSIVNNSKHKLDISALDNY